MTHWMVHNNLVVLSISIGHLRDIALEPAGLPGSGIVIAYRFVQFHLKGHGPKLASKEHPVAGSIDHK